MASVNSIRRAADDGRRVDNRARVLLILSDDVLARARVLAGQATMKLKLPVSLQIILRALIEEGLTRKNHPALLASIEAHANAIRRTRKLARRRVGSDSGAQPSAEIARRRR
jgi:hypothetical protein